MKDVENSWRYWSVDLPGLSRSSAEELLRIAERAGMSTAGSLVDPAQFLTAHLDRDTVEAVYAALSRMRSSEDDASQSDAHTVNGFRELLEEWLGDIRGG